MPEYNIYVYYLYIINVTYDMTAALESERLWRRRQQREYIILLLLLYIDICVPVVINIKIRLPAIRYTHHNNTLTGEIRTYWL
jgi:hypothetical protein